MRLMTRRKLWTVGSAWLLTLCTALTHSALPARAQAPAGQMPDKIYTKSSSFDLPVLMKDNTQQSLREVNLWVKAPAGNWVKQDTALPSASKFSYRVQQDGEYWFNLVTVDNQGRMTPPDVTTAPPGLRVVVDTKPPVIEVQASPADQGDYMLRCTVQDANPNPSSLRAVARATVGEVNLDASQPGVYRVRPELLSCPIRITVSDLAGNSTTREVGDGQGTSGRPQPSRAPGRRCAPARARGRQHKQPGRAQDDA